MPDRTYRLTMTSRALAQPQDYTLRGAAGATQDDDALMALAGLEIGNTYTDWEGDTWERIA